MSRNPTRWQKAWQMERARGLKRIVPNDAVVAHIEWLVAQGHEVYGTVRNLDSAGKLLWNVSYDWMNPLQYNHPAPVDVNGDGVIRQTEDFELLGDPWPTATWGMTNTFGYGPVTFRAGGEQYAAPALQP